MSDVAPLARSLPRYRTPDMTGQDPFLSQQPVQLSSAPLLPASRRLTFCNVVMSLPAVVMSMEGLLDRTRMSITASTITVSTLYDKIR